MTKITEQEREKIYYLALNVTQQKAAKVSLADIQAALRSKEKFTLYETATDAIDDAPKCSKETHYLPDIIAVKLAKESDIDHLAMTTEEIQKISVNKNDIQTAYWEAQKTLVMSTWHRGYLFEAVSEAKDTYGSTDHQTPTSENSSCPPPDSEVKACHVPFFLNPHGPRGKKTAKEFVTELDGKIEIYEVITAIKAFYNRFMGNWFKDSFKCHIHAALLARYGNEDEKTAFSRANKTVTKLDALAFLATIPDRIIAKEFIVTEPSLGHRVVLGTV